MNRKNTIITGLLLAAGMLLLLAYANVEEKITLFGHTLVKSRELRFLPTPAPKRPTERISKPVIATDSSTNKMDTSAKNVLLIGDSESGGLVYPFADYCRHNGHQVKAAMTWSSATDMTYANDDTLAGIIRRYKPDYIFIVIGLNQIYQTSFDGSIEAVQKIVKLFGDIPYAWIGPANWVDDKGINDIYANYTHEGSFFLSKHLKLGRGSDGRHPDNAGYGIWMDSIAQWIMTKSRWRIKMNKPLEYKRKIDFPIIILNAGKPRNKGNENKNPSRPDSSSQQPDIPAPEKTVPPDSIKFPAPVYLKK